MEANSSIQIRSHKPGGGPEAQAPDSPRQAVAFFEQIIAGLYEKDYGDFMRKCNLYLERLAIDITGASAEIFKMLERMRMYTVYAPDFDIENTRIRLIHDAAEIRRRI